MRVNQNALRQTLHKSGFLEVKLFKNNLWFLVLSLVIFVRNLNFQELNSYLEYLFKLIVERGPDVGLKVSLNRYDLFHGHLFIATETGRLGIL